MTFELVLLVLFAFALSAWLTFQFSLPGSRLYILDHPTARSLHSSPVPRSGGVAMLVAILTVSGLLCALRGETPAGWPWLVAALLLAAGVGFVDDRRSLSARVRLLVHGAAAVLVVMGGFMLQPLALPGWVANFPREAALLVTWLFVVWMINLYNFMDGMDGFAGGMTLIGFSAFALMGMRCGHTLFALLSWAIAFAALGFLCFNFPPARIFMGDVGAYSLGLLAAGFTLWGMRDGLFPFWVAVLIFSPFIVDATVTLIWRTLRGESVWQAHRTHFYQRLVLRGFGHRKTVLGQYALMSACAASALTASYLSHFAQWLMLAFWTAAYLVLIMWAAQACRRNAPE